MTKYAQLPNGRYVGYPDDWTREQLDSHVFRDYPDLFAKPQPSTTDQVLHALGQGVKSVGSSITDALGFGAPAQPAPPDAPDTFLSSLAKPVQNLPALGEMVAGGLMQAQSDPLAGLKGQVADQAENGPPGTMDYLTNAAKLVASGDASRLLLRPLMGEALKPKEEALRSAGQKLGEAGSKAYQANQPEGLSGMGQVGYDIARAAVEMAPTYVAAYLTRNPTLVPVIMTAQMKGQSYQDSVEQGLEPYKAAARSNFTAFAEGVPEYIPGLAILSKTGPAAKLAWGALGEGAQEMVTQVLEDTYDKQALENMSLKDAIQNIDWGNVVYAGLVGAGAGGAVASGVAGVEALSNKAQGKEQVSAEDQQANDALHTLAGERAREALDPNRGVVSDQPRPKAPEGFTPAGQASKEEKADWLRERVKGVPEETIQDLADKIDMPAPTEPTASDKIDAEMRVEDDVVATLQRVAGISEREARNIVAEASGNAEPAAPVPEASPPPTAAAPVPEKQQLALPAPVEKMAPAPVEKTAPAPVEKMAPTPEAPNPERLQIAPLAPAPSSVVAPTKNKQYYHGSGRIFSKFDPEMVGSGEGNAAYGWGVAYIAEAPKVATGYRNREARNATLDSEQIKKYFKVGSIVPSYSGQDRVLALDVGNDGRFEVTVQAVDKDGNPKPYERTRSHATMPSAKQYEELTGEKLGALYTVEVPEKYTKDFLDWDKPLSEQSESVQRKLAVVRENPEFDLSKESDIEPGGAVYARIAGALGEGGIAGDSWNDKAASEYLNSLGIKGIRYLDGDSRAAGEGAHNLVVFDADIMKITHRDGKPITRMQEQDIKDNINQEETPNAVQNTQAETNNDRSLQGPEVRQTGGDTAERGVRVPPSGQTEAAQPEAVDATGPKAPPGTFGTLQANPIGQMMDVWEDMAGKALDRWHDAVGWRMDPLGKMPAKERFSAERYRLLGKIGDVNRMMNSIKKTFRHASESDQSEIYFYLTTKSASPLQIQDRDARKMAIEVKRQFQVVLRRIVEEGFISEEASHTYEGGYLPRVYLYFLLGKKKFHKLAGGKKVSNLGWSRTRDEGLHPDIREHLYGEIKDPAYLAAKGLGTELRDMAIFDFLKFISINKEWVHKDTVVNWDGRLVSTVWLDQRMKELERQAAYYEDAARIRTLNFIGRMRAVLADATPAGKTPVNSDDYRKVPDDRRYGRLRGMWVRKEIYDDMLATGEMMSADPDIWSNLFTVGGYGTKAQQIWKLMKVALNPPAQVVNFGGNMVLLHLSGVPLYQVLPYAAKAIHQISTDGKYWRLAKKGGVTQSTYAAQELFRMDRELLDLQARHAGKLSWSTIKNALATIAEKGGDTYQFMESIGKTARIMYAMEKEGKNLDEAVDTAQHWLFDYSQVPQWVRTARNAPFGAPFITFYYKILPRALEAAVVRPWVYLPYLVLPSLMAGLFAYMNDVDDDDVKALMKAYPMWLQDRGHGLLLPYKDSEGRWQAYDFGRYLPWIMWEEMVGKISDGEIEDAVIGSGIFGGPMSSLLWAVSKNEDMFTGKKIRTEGAPAMEQMMEFLTWMYTMAAPTWLTNQGFLGKLIDATTEDAQLNAESGGKTILTKPQAFLRLFGQNVYPFDPVQSRMRNIEKMGEEYDAIKAYQRDKIQDINNDAGKTDAQKDAEIDELIAKDEIRMEKIMEKIDKYRNESEVPASLETIPQDLFSGTLQ